MADEPDKRVHKLPEELVARLREDPWRDLPVARVGDRAFFAPDGLYLEVVHVAREGVTSRVMAPRDAPELGEERTVSLADWQGMFDEGTLRGVPERPRVGEPWTDRNLGLWFVAAVGEGEAVMEAPDGTTETVPLRPDGLPADRERGWARVDVDAQGEARESWEGY